jgi:hypothetical protein
MDENPHQGVQELSNEETFLRKRFTYESKVFIFSVYKTLVKYNPDTGIYNADKKGGIFV